MSIAHIRWRYESILPKCRNTLGNGLLAQSQLGTPILRICPVWGNRRFGPLLYRWPRQPIAIPLSVYSLVLFVLY